MTRRLVFLATLVVMVTLATCSEAGAWGARHVGYTHYGPVTGLHHAGYTSVHAGGYGGYHAGAYHAGGYGGAYHYGGYHYGGYHYGGGGVHYGYARRW